MLADSLTKAVDEITTQDHRFYIMGMDLKDGKVVFVQQFHPNALTLEQAFLQQRQPLTEEVRARQPPPRASRTSDETATNMRVRC